MNEYFISSEVSQQLSVASRAEGAVLHFTDVETEDQEADFTKATRELREPHPF